MIYEERLIKRELYNGDYIYTYVVQVPLLSFEGLGEIADPLVSAFAFITTPLESW